MFNKDWRIIEEDIKIFIKKTVLEAGFNKVVVGLSGGIDSATVSYLCAKALGRENVIPVILPHGQLHKYHKDDAYLVIKKLGIPKKNIYEINIQKAVDAIARYDKHIDQIRKGNIMSRVRMIYLYDIAKKHKALVCGTENKTEYLLGYFTRHGDEAADLEPIRHLYKAEVFRLAQMYLGVPEEFLVKSPSAGLWEGQTDEEEFGFSYEDADKILYLKFDKKLSEVEIINTSGIDKTIVKKILTRVAENSFKHEVPKVLDH